MAAAIPAGAIFLVVSDWLDGWSQKEVETAAPSLRGAMEECRKRDNWQKSHTVWVWEGKREGDDIIARPVERGLGGWLMGEPQPVLWW